MAIAVGDTVTFAGGANAAVTRVTDFTTADRLNVANAGAATNLAGVGSAATVAGTAYFASGNYNAATGIFTIEASTPILTAGTGGELDAAAATATTFSLRTSTPSLAATNLV